MGRRKRILTIIDEIEKDESTNVVALPLMCGSGKSTAISEKIAESIRKKEGLLVVTDRTNRFKQYLEPRDETLREYIQKNASKIACLTTQTVNKVDKCESERTVLMMTTQRFFRIRKEQLDKYLSWGFGKKRKLILFDEQPELFFQKRIDLGTLNKFEELFIRSVNTIAEPQKRNELIHWWNSKKLAFLTRTSMAENCSDGRDNYYTMIPPEPIYENEYGDIDDSDDYSKLDDVLSQKIKHPQDSRYDPYAIVRGLKLFSASGALYGYRSDRTGKYESYIMPTQSEKERLANSGAKVIILDGTANLSLEYEKSSYISVEGKVCEPYVRKIPNLHIILVKDHTSKATVASQSIERVRRFEKFIQSDSHCSEVYIFSYKQIVNALNDAKKEETDQAELIVNWDYFGNIKGRNDFQDYTVFGQVGLFTRPESFYLTKLIELYPEVKQKFNKFVNGPDSYNESSRLIEKIKKSETYKELKYKDILADIEQNVFRSQVRSDNYQGDIRYYLFFDYEYHDKLKDLIVERFAERYGAEVSCCNPFAVYELVKIRNSKNTDCKKTIAQRILEYTDALEDGDHFSRKELLIKTGLSASQFNSTIQRYEVLKRTFLEWRLPNQNGIYRKQEIETKPDR